MDFEKLVYFFSEEKKDKELTEIIDIYTSWYHNGIDLPKNLPLLTDEQYDFLIDIYEKRYGILEKIGAEPRHQYRKKVILPYWLGSMNKIKKNDELALKRWIIKCPGPYIITEKLDGMSAMLHYKKNEEPRLYTRGDGNIGMDITHIIPFLSLPQINAKNDIIIRGELLFTKEIFINNYATLFANARNTVISGCVTSKVTDKELCKNIHFQTFEVIEPLNLSKTSQLHFLKKIGFSTVKYKKIKNIDINTLGTHLENFKKNSKYEIDGIVIYDDELSLKGNNKFGNPEYAFAFKGTGETAITTVESIEWNPSKSGALKPRIKINPVVLSGVQINYTTGFNAKYIYNNNIGPGTQVEITRSGDVIPYITQIIQPSASPSMPENITYEWNDTETDIFISFEYNLYDNQCKDQVEIKKIIHFFHTMKTERLNKGTIEKLYKFGFKTIPDILKIKIEDIEHIPGFGKKSASVLVRNIESTCKNVELYNLLAATSFFGVGLGEKKMKLITDLYPNFIYEENIVERITNIKGFSEDTAKKIAKGVPDFLLFLQETGIILIKKEKIDSSLNNKKIVFTGFRDLKLKEKVEFLGGKVQDTVTKDVFMVVQKGEINTNKCVKANEYGIPIVSKEDFDLKLEKY